MFSKIKNYVVRQRFAKQVDSQICQSVLAQIKYQLSSANLSKENEERVKESLNNVIDALDYDEVKSEQELKFNEALESNDYKKVLKVFNEKSLSKSVGHYFGVNDKEYCGLVISLLNGAKHDEIVSALSPYLPDGIPR